jgi:hypothetical protein
MDFKILTNRNAALIKMRDRNEIIQTGFLKIGCNRVLKYRLNPDYIPVEKPKKPEKVAKVAKEVKEPAIPKRSSFIENWSKVYPEFFRDPCFKCKSTVRIMDKQI